MGQVRIIGGIHRSRILKFKDGVNGLRPTPDRVRETLFNWLGQDLIGKTCLDLFAGSGALGFEALSRNAKWVTLVEKDNAVIKDLRRNQEILAMSNIEITNSNGINYLERLPKGFDVIFLDPPYQSDLLSKSLDIISKTDVLSNSGVVYIEYQTRPNLDGYDIIKESKAGNVGYMLITPIRK
jgi:16S rRNA (guanine966-N2)-methyltransferase